MPYSRHDDIIDNVNYDDAMKAALDDIRSIIESSNGHCKYLIYPSCWEQDPAMLEHIIQVASDSGADAKSLECEHETQNQTLLSWGSGSYDHRSDDLPYGHFQGGPAVYDRRPDKEVSAKHSPLKRFVDTMHNLIS